MAGRLSRKIDLRLEREQLPAQLVRRLDEIDRDAKHTSPNDSRNVPMYVVFQLVNQNDEPILRSAFRINVSGSNELLEDFPRGYYLFSYTSSSSTNYPCKISFTDSRFKTRLLEVTASARRVRDAGKLPVKEFDESDKLPASVRVISADGAPLEGVNVSVSPTSPYGSNSTPSNLSTDANGNGVLQLFPGRYSVLANKHGYRPARAALRVAKGNKNPSKLTLHESIPGSALVEWRNVSLSEEETVTTGNAVFEVNRMGYTGRNIGARWLGFYQDKNRLVLALGDARSTRFRLPNGTATSNWARFYPSNPKASGEAPQEQFKQIELANIEDLKEKGKTAEKLAPPVQHDQFASHCVVKPGDILYGMTATTHPNTGRPVEIQFKVLIRGENEDQK